LAVLKGGARLGRQLPEEGGPPKFTQIPNVEMKKTFRLCNHVRKQPSNSPGSQGWKNGDLQKRKDAGIKKVEGLLGLPWERKMQDTKGNSFLGVRKRGEGLRHQFRRGKGAGRGEVGGG